MTPNKNFINKRVYKRVLSICICISIRISINISIMASDKPQHNKPTIQKYGEILLEKYNLADTRQEFTYDFTIDHTNNPSTADENIRRFLETLLQMTPEQASSAVIVHKTIEKPGLKWHIDDCQLVNFKTAPTYNLEQYIHLEGSRYLYFNTPTKTLPKYTILFYSSTYKEDFDGGLLTLADGTQIIPKKQNGILLDSREAHMVTPVSRGIRNVTVVKIYNFEET